MKRWIAFETDESGWPSDAFLVVAAENRDDARSAMAHAITQRRAGETSRELRARISDIFIEAPHELDDDDPRGSGLEDGVARFEGFTPAPAA